jgi:hypothetical protein
MESASAHPPPDCLPSQTQLNQLFMSHDAMLGLCNARNLSVDSVRPF